MENNIIIKIKNLSKLDNSYGSIARYLLEHHNEEDLSIKAICDACFIAPPSVTRFAKKIGYSGFYEFKYELLNQQKNISTEEISKHENLTITAIAKQQQALLNTSINQMIEVFEQKVVDEVINEINTAERIFIFAVGGTSVCAEDFKKKLWRININAEASNDRHDQYFLAKNANENDLFIGISYSGTTEEIIKGLQIAKNSNAKTVLISTVNQNPEIVDYHLEVHAEESASRNTTTVARVAILFLLDVIFLTIVNGNKKHQELLEQSNYKSDWFNI